MLSDSIFVYMPGRSFAFVLKSAFKANAETSQQPVKCNASRDSREKSSLSSQAKVKEDFSQTTIFWSRPKPFLKRTIILTIYFSFPNGWRCATSLLTAFPKEAYRLKQSQIENKSRFFRSLNIFRHLVKLRNLHLKSVCHHYQSTFISQTSYLKGRNVHLYSTFHVFQTQQGESISEE